MARTFNCGLGMVAVVAAERADALTQVLAEAGERVLPVGHVVAAPAGSARVLIEGWDEAWKS